ALSTHGGITLHVDRLHGINSHHIAEAAFKSVARALREAVEPDARMAGALPSTKGALSAPKTEPPMRTPKTLTVLADYDSGNLHSAEKAFQRMAAETGGGHVIVSSDPEMVAKADRIVLPGDGAFPACRQALTDHTGLFEAIDEAVTQRARPS